jgi:hypothetical protein
VCANETNMDQPGSDMPHDMSDSMDVTMNTFRSTRKAERSSHQASATAYSMGARKQAAWRLALRRERHPVN